MSKTEKLTLKFESNSVDHKVSVHTNSRNQELYNLFTRYKDSLSTLLHVELSDKLYDMTFLQTLRNYTIMPSPSFTAEHNLERNWNLFRAGVKPAFKGSGFDTCFIPNYKDYPLVDLEKEFIIFQTEDLRRAFLEEFSGPRVSSYSEIEGLYLGFPPQACKTFRQNVASRVEMVVVDFYGLIFASDLSNLLDNLRWSWSTYPEASKTGAGVYVSNDVLRVRLREEDFIINTPIGQAG
ncbi:hypothetical protein D3C71_1291620 [compost metagenome]